MFCTEYIYFLEYRQLNFVSIHHVLIYFPDLGGGEVGVEVHVVLVAGPGVAACARAGALGGALPAVRVERGQQRDVCGVHQPGDPLLLIIDGGSEQ